MIDPTRVKMSTDPATARMRGVTIHGNVPFDVPYVSEILGNLWLGGCENGLTLPSHFKHLVSLYPWERYKVNHDLDSALVVRMYDSSDDVDMEQILAIADWTNTCLNSGPTLLHCQAGLNRSSMVAAITLLTRDGTLTPDSVISLIREKRSPACLCNKTFEKVVRDFKIVEPLIG